MSHLLNKHFALSKSAFSFSLAAFSFLISCQIFASENLLSDCKLSAAEYKQKWATLNFIFEPNNSDTEELAEQVSACAQFKDMNLGGNYTVQISGNSYNVNLSNGTRPLHLATRIEGYKSLFVNALLEMDANTQLKNSDGQTPLLFALKTWNLYSANLIYGKVKEKKLLNQVINQADLYGMTALHYAASIDYGFEAKEHFISILLADGAQAQKNMLGQTPVMIAAHYNDENTLNLFEQAGFSFTTKDKQNRNALYYSISCEAAEILFQGLPDFYYNDLAPMTNIGSTYKKLSSKGLKLTLNERKAILNRLAKKTHILISSQELVHDLKKGMSN